MQLIAIAPGLSGFAIGVFPSFMLRPAGKYGFRDRLAVLDSNLIIWPLSRTTAACFTAKRFAPTLLELRLNVDTSNAFFIRAALKEVVCHPEHAQYLEGASSQRDNLPIDKMLGAPPASGLCDRGLCWAGVDQWVGAPPRAGPGLMEGV